MIIKNLHSGLAEPIDIGDILYSYFDQGGYRTQERQKTWSFRCQGLVSTAEHDYILGPGNTIYQLGIDCFTSDNEARSVGYYHKTLPKRDTRRQYRFSILSDEEKVRI